MVLVTSALMTKANKKDIVVLDQVFYIYYPIWSKKNEIQVLIDFSIEVNAITLRYALKQGLKVCFIDVKTSKINSSTFEIFEIVLASK